MTTSNEFWKKWDNYPSFAKEKHLLPMAKFMLSFCKSMDTLDNAEDALPITAGLLNSYFLDLETYLRNKEVQE